MRKISKSNHYKKFGYFVHNIKKDKIVNLRKTFIQAFSLMSDKVIKKKIKNDQDIIKLYRSKNRKLWVGVYDSIKFHPDLFDIAGSNIFRKIAKIAGIKKPCHGARPLVRVDMPDDAEFSFKAHQDYPYNMGSSNSITIWIPLQDTNVDMGALQVAAKSHIPKRILKYSLDGKKFNVDLSKRVQKKQALKANEDSTYKMSVNDKKYKFKSINLKVGQALIFSQYLLHKSGLNISSKIRFSVQLRFNDLNEKEYAKRNYFLWIR